MKRLLIALLLLITIGLGGAWYAYQCGYRLPVTPAHSESRIPPVFVADTATEYTLIQREQLGELKFPDNDRAAFENWAKHSEDKTFVPHALKYVRVEYLAAYVEKPYPKIFFAEQGFPTDVWMSETVAVVKPTTMTKILSSAETLSCAANSAILNEPTDQVEVLMRDDDTHLKRCLLDHKSGCEYLNRLRQMARELGGMNGYELPTLEERLKCHTVIPLWERYVTFPADQSKISQG